MNKKLRPTQITKSTKKASLEGRGDSPLVRLRDRQTTKSNNNKH